MDRRPVEEQVLVQGPMASQVAIKMLGTNGVDTPMPMPRIPSRIRRRFRIFFRCCRSSPLEAG